MQDRYIPVPEVDDDHWLDEYSEDEAVDTMRLMDNYEQAGRYWDDVNGGYLENDKVEEARREEIAWIIKRQILRKVPRSACPGKADSYCGGHHADGGRQGSCQLRGADVGHPLA